MLIIDKLLRKNMNSLIDAIYCN